MFREFLDLRSGAFASALLKEMNEFIAYLVKNLVDKPDFVEVQILEKPEQTVIELKVSEEDIAKVVGRHGKTIKSLRTIVMSIGARFGKRVHLELVN